MAADTKLPWEMYKESERGRRLLNFYARNENGETLERLDAMSRLTF